MELKRLKAKFSNDITKRWLENNKWYYSKMLSTEEETIYTYRFAVYTYGIHTTLECEFMVSYQTKLIDINIFEAGSRTLYAPFYYQEYGNYDSIMSIIIKNIEKEMRRMNIEYVNDNSR